MIRKFLGKSGARGATIVDYGILVGLLSAVSIGSLVAMGVTVRDTADNAHGELAEATAELGPAETDPNAGPLLSDLTAADLDDIETYGARTYMDGTTIFLADTARRGNATFDFLSATGVTMREDDPTCATGPFNSADGDTQTISCSYADTTPAPENRAFVRVPGDGWLEQLMITDDDGMYVCYRDTTDAEDPHTFSCSPIT